MYNKRTIKPAIRQRRIPQLYTLHFYFYTFLSKCNSLYIKDLTYERFRTKDYVRNFNLFMQNEPKLQQSQVNVNNVLTSNYENKTLGEHGKNEPKRTQNEPKVKIGKIEPNPLLQKNLYKFPPLRTYKNEPKRTQIKPNSKGQFPKQNSCRTKNPYSPLNLMRPVFVEKVIKNFIPKDRAITSMSDYDGVYYKKSLNTCCYIFSVADKTLKLVFNRPSKMSKVVTKPWIWSCGSITARQRLRDWRIFSIISASDVSCVTLWTGVLIIHLILICSVASSNGLRHLANIGRR